MSITDELLNNNAAEGAGLQPRCRADAASDAGPDARLHGCPPQRRRDLGVQGRAAHVIRNAGRVVSDDAIRLWLVSGRPARDPGTTVLIHHTSCDMLTFGDDGVKAAIEAATGLAPLSALEAFADLDQDVRQSVARIRRAHWCRKSDAVGGFVHEVAVGVFAEVLDARAGPSGRRSTQPRKHLKPIGPWRSTARRRP